MRLRNLWRATPRGSVWNIELDASVKIFDGECVTLCKEDGDWGDAIPPTAEPTVGSPDRTNPSTQWKLFTSIV